MALYQPHHFTIPEDTAEVARAAFPKGNVYMTMREELGPLFQDADFAALFSLRGQAGQSPAFLAIVTVLQFMEGLPIARRRKPFCAGHATWAWPRPICSTWPPPRRSI